MVLPVRMCVRTDGVRIAEQLLGVGVGVGVGVGRMVCPVACRISAWWGGVLK